MFCGQRLTDPYLMSVKPNMYGELHVCMLCLSQNSGNTSNIILKTFKVNLCSAGVSSWQSVVHGTLRSVPRTHSGGNCQSCSPNNTAGSNQGRDAPLWRQPAVAALNMSDDLHSRGFDEAVKINLIKPQLLNRLRAHI